MKKILFVAISLACLAACTKDKGDSQEPMIQVSSPTANQQFTAGQTVNVVATITDNNELHEVHLTVVNKTTSLEVVHFHNHVDVKSYNMNQSFVVGAGITYNIKVEAEDHAGNHAQAEFEIRGN